MKRLLLLCTGLLIGLTTVSATELNHKKQKTKLEKTKRYRYAQPIIFIERGVEFLIFPDGSFDFNTNTKNSHYNNNTYYRSNSKRANINTTYGTRHKAIKYTSRYENKGVSVSRNRNGKIRRIGNVYLNYDRYGKLKRAGSIYMHYSNRHHYASLKKVGGLHITYNRFGEIINTRGQVNQYRNYCNLCGVSSCSINHSYKNKRHHDDYNWYDNDDDNYYYYKQNGKVKKSKKRK